MKTEVLITQYQNVKTETTLTESEMIIQNKNIPYYAMPGILNKQKTIALRVYSDSQKIDYWISVITKVSKIDKIDLLSKSRLREYVMPRHLLMYHIRQELPHVALTKIGSKFNRDHTSVMHACTNIDNLLCVNDKTITELYHQFLNEIDEDKRRFREHCNNMKDLDIPSEHL